MSSGNKKPLSSFPAEAESPRGAVLARILGGQAGAVNARPCPQRGVLTVCRIQHHRAEQRVAAMRTKGGSNRPGRASRARNEATAVDGGFALCAERPCPSSLRLTARQDAQ